MRSFLLVAFVTAICSSICCTNIDPPSPILRPPPPDGGEEFIDDEIADEDCGDACGDE